METSMLPNWIGELAEEDLQFIRRFVLASGSLKALAAEYDVSYPTLRIRLDRLIAKIAATEDPAQDNPFRRTVRHMVADGQIGPEQARRLMNAHREYLNSLEKSK